MPTKKPKPTLFDAVREAKAILARDEALEAMPRFVREAELADPGSIHSADRDVAVCLLKIFVDVIEGLDPEMVGVVKDMARLEQEARRR